MSNKWENREKFEKLHNKLRKLNEKKEKYK